MELIDLEGEEETDLKDENSFEVCLVLNRFIVIEYNRCIRSLTRDTFSFFSCTN